MAIHYEPISPEDPRCKNCGKKPDEHKVQIPLGVVVIGSEVDLLEAIKEIVSDFNRPRPL